MLGPGAGSGPENGCSMGKNDCNLSFCFIIVISSLLCLLILYWTTSQVHDLGDFISPSQESGLHAQDREPPSWAIIRWVCEPGHLCPISHQWRHSQVRAQNCSMKACPSWQNEPAPGQSSPVKWGGVRCPEPWLAMATGRAKVWVKGKGCFSSHPLKGLSFSSFPILSLCSQVEERGDIFD